MLFPDANGGIGAVNVAGRLKQIFQRHHVDFFVAGNPR